MEGRVGDIRRGRSLVGLLSVLIAAASVMGTCFMAFPTKAGNDVTLAYVDIGDDETMAAVMVGWGPIEPSAEHGGNWGGYGDVSSELYGQHTRVVWYEDWLDDGVNFDPNGRDATIKFSFVGSARWIEFSHLDGICDDSFELYANGLYGPVLIFDYDDCEPANDVEEWITETVYLSEFIGCEMGPIYVGGCNFELIFTATAPLNDDGVPWWGWETYGTLAIDHIYVHGNGEGIPEA